MKGKVTRNFLLFLLAFLGIGALGGGAVLIISPGGEILGVPLSMLDNSPFKSFLIPGIVLFLVFGLSPVLLIGALLKKPGSKLAEQLNFYSDMHWSWSFTIYNAIALIIWIQIQQLMVDGVHWLHSFYMILAMVMLIIVLMPAIRNHYRK